MSKYIKSHSNYVLKSRHQAIKDGTIFERNITTIGGINDFPNGQMPIYKSGNFLVTVRGGGLETNQYNLDKWEENQTSGTVWNWESVSGITSQLHEDNDTKIVLKQDYYDLSDFAYYGSMTELFRTSVTDILARFPGELYCTSDNAYYTVTSYEDGERIDESVLLGGEEYTYVDNPFAIDIHSLKKPIDGKELKFFADGGYENYEVIYPNGTSKPIIYWEVEPKEEPTDGFHKGDCVLSIKINEDVVVSGFIGDNCDIVYLVESGHHGIHIRPKKKFQDIFYNECSNFQKLLMNKDTDYTAIFSVIRENDYGYYRELVSLKFPTSIGNYNIDASGYGFNDYTRQMVEIGEFYDERFTDNMWRSMTHEAIKNFDWTYTREFQEGDEEEYVLGGQRIQKALRIFAREFDEILSYINNIKNINRVTYDERSNIPDYFLTDIVENSGWNVKLVYPYTLNEYYYKTSDNNTIKELLPSNGYTSNNENCIGQLYNNEEINGKRYNIFREFTQDTSGSVVPYSSDMLGVMKNGYFLACNDCSNSISTTASSDTYVYRLSSGETSWYDECTEKLKNRIKSYTNETVWTAQECNNEFLRVLKINSPYIWRNKGTLEGIEMILGMFGLKSKRWSTKKNGANAEYDFDVTEYTSFTHRVEEPWDAIHQNYRINWLNSTKLISYDNRFISNYDKYGYDLNKIPYQGLPVSYREEYINSDTSSCAYIKKDSLESQIQQMSGGTYSGSDSGNSFTREDGSSVVRRYLYPNFNNKEELDGNIYYQMDGGWLSKIIIESNNSQYNFQYDKDNNINFTNNVQSVETLYKETVRNIRRVENVGELLTLPLNQLHNGIICNVSKIEKNTAIIDGVAYPIEKEYMSNGNVSEYITFTKYEGFIKVGENKYFDSTMIVYDENNATNFNPRNNYTEGDDVVDNKKLYRFGKKYNASEYRFKTTSAYTIGDVVVEDNILWEFIEDHTAGQWKSDEVKKTDLSALISKGVVSEPCISYDILDRPNGSSIKAYIGNGIAFKCQEDTEGDYSIDSFINLNTMWNDSQYTNYFVLDDINYSPYVSSASTSGWKRLQPTDSEYIKVNTIINDYKGNNPHNGNMVYDNGHEYFTYFKRLFKYAIDNDLFDSRCFDDYAQTLDDEIVYYGFSGLVENDETKLNYDSFISADTKIHYFGNYKTKNENNNIAKIWIYGEDTDRINNFRNIYSEETSSVSGYILNASATTEGWLEDYNPYSGHTEKCIDEVTNQIMNNKRLCITFNLHNTWYKKEGQEEIKYLDDIVMNYLTQMIPSTSILQVKYQSKV